MRALQAIKLAYHLWKQKDSNLVKHAKLEFDCVWPEKEAMQDLMKDNLLELLQVFSSQGHSGFSANYCLQAFQKLAKYETLGPLTGCDSEWSEAFCGEGTLQNKRDGRVFKNPDGTAYFIEGKIFREPNGCCFTSSESRVIITSWPYTPISEYIDVNKD